MASLLNPESPRIPPNGIFGEMQPCFVCNKEFHNSEKTVAVEVLEELSQIQKTLYDVFGISGKRSPEPFKENPFCRMCERRAREMLRITTELQALQVQLDKVRDEMATAIVSTYIYSSKENPNFEIKHLIFEKWYDKVDVSNVTQPGKSDSDLSPVSDVPTPKVKLKPDSDDPKRKGSPSNTPISKPKRSELEVASLIRQSEERMSCDPNSDKVEEASCSICSKVYRNKDLLEVHLKTHGEDKPCCKICGRSFFENARLKRHMQQNHPEYEGSDTASIKSPMASPGSDNDVKGQGVPDSTTDSPASTSTAVKAKGKEKKRSFVRCETCGKQYGNKKLLQKHNRKEHAAKKKMGKRCSGCGKFKYCTCNSESASVSYQCPLDGVIFNAKMGYELHFSVDHPGKSMRDPVIVEDQMDEDNDGAYSDRFDDGDNDLEEEPKYTLEADKEEVKKFKRLHPTYKHIKFNLSVSLARIPISVLMHKSVSVKTATEQSTEEKKTQDNAQLTSEEKEEEKRPPHILKSVAWKAKGAWFTQEKTTPSSTPTATPKPLDLQSNWKSFLEKKNPKPKPKPKPTPSTSASRLTSNLSGQNSPAPETEDQAEDKIDKSEDQQSESSSRSSDLSNKDDGPGPASSTEKTKSDENVTDNPSKRCNEDEPGSSGGPHPKKPTNSTYWVDPKNVIQSGPVDDPKASSPFLAQALLEPPKPKPPAARKPGPLSMRKLSDITHALRLGLKKSKPNTTNTNPARGPSSEQITKLARQLRQGGVGINKGKFDPVFQLHPLGGPMIKPSNSNGSSPAPALALNVEKDEKKKGNGNGVKSKPGPASRKTQSQLQAPTPPRLCETSLEEETDMLSLMQNSNPVTVLPSTTVCSPVDVIHRSLKRMAGPKSKTKMPHPASMPELNPSSSPKPNTPAETSSFRFVDVEDLLSRSAREDSLVDDVFSSTKVSNSTGPPPHSYSSANGLLPNIPTKPISESEDSSDVECLDSEDDMDDDDDHVPKIRIRNLQSLAEPEEEEEGEIVDEDEEEDVMPMPMELESTETYCPVITTPVPTSVVKNNLIRVQVDGRGLPAAAAAASASVRRGSQDHNPQPQRHQLHISSVTTTSTDPTLNALSRINNTTPQEIVENEGFYAYTEKSLRNFFSQKNSTPLPLPPPRVAPAPAKSPPTETYVYTISPEDMPIPNSDERPGPVITSVYSQGQVQPQVHHIQPKTEVTQTQPQPAKVQANHPTFIPARITVNNPSSSSAGTIVTPRVTVTPVVQRPGRKPSPSLISDVDLDSLLGI